MIEDHLIVYPNPPYLWAHYEFPSTAGNAIIIAILSTVISYQATALLFDLILGLKNPRQAKISTLHTLLLIRKSSPFAILNSILRNNTLTTLFFKRFIPTSNPSISRQTNHIPSLVLVRLLFLLFLAPILNIVSIVLTFDKKAQPISFRDANLGGLALGFNTHLPFPPIPTLFGQYCQEFPIQEKYGDVITASLSICGARSSFFTSEKPVGSIRVYMLNLAGVNNTIRVDITIGAKKVRLERRALLERENELYSINSFLPNESVRPIVNMVMDDVLVACREGEEQTMKGADLPELDYDPGRAVTFEIMFKQIECLQPKNAQSVIDSIIKKIDNSVTFVDAEKFLVRDTNSMEGDAKLLDGQDIGLLVRRRRIAGIPVLAIIALFVTALRILASVLLNNDVHKGIEILLKEKFGLKCSDSFIHEGNFTVHYPGCNRVVLDND